MSGEKIYYSESNTINIGNYQSKRVEVGFEAIMNGDETRTDAFKRARNFVKVVLDKRTVEVCEVFGVENEFGSK